jgi:Putative auto-transporter adhesin, head GIN domain
MFRPWLALLPLFALAAPAAAAERRYAVTDFDRVVVEGPYIVRLTAGRASSAVASGTPAALDRVLIDVTGQTLRIRRNRSYWGGNPGAQEGPLTIDLTTRIVRSARVIGPGRLDVDRAEGLRVDLIVEGGGRLTASNVAADNLSIGLAGSCRLDGAGTAETLSADIQGTGDVDGTRLRTEHATLIVGTTGNVAFDVSRTANVTAVGLGNVEISGNAACTVRGVNADLVRCASNQRQYR